MDPGLDAADDSEGQLPFGLEREAGASARHPFAQSQLKHEFDAIFHDIERNLPSIDDSTDDEDLLEPVEVFQHPIRGGHPFSDDDEKDLDESLSSINGDGSGNYGYQHFNASVPGNNKTAIEISPATIEGPMTSPREHANNVEAYAEAHFSLPPVIAWTNGEAELDISQAPVYVSSRYPTHGARHDPENARNQVQPHSEVVQGQPSIRLSMNGLEHIDLDLLLQRVVEKEYRTRSRKISVGLDDIIMQASHQSSDDETTQQLPAAAQVPANNDVLIEKLAALCETQYGTALHVDARTGAAVQRTSSVHDSKTASVSAGYQTENRQTSHVRNAAASSGASTMQNSQKEEERQTVFLDLRKSEGTGVLGLAKDEMQEAVARRVLGLHSITSSDSSSSDDDDDNADDRSTKNSYSRDAWFEQRRRIRESLSNRVTTSTQVVAQQNKLGSGTADYGNRRTVPAERKAKVSNKKSEQQQQGKPAASLPNQLQHSSENVCLADGQQPGPSVNAATGTGTSSAIGSSAHSTAAQTSGRGGKHKLAAEQIAQSRARLKNNLDALRPKHSTSGKQACAEATPVVFDSVGSYSSPVSSFMAAQVALSESILLTVHLASNGEVVEHRSSAMKPIDASNGWPSSYLVLLSWLASLIPDFDGGLKTAGDAVNNRGCPFDVAGIQQMWFNGRLVLAVAAVPSDDYKEKHSALAKKFKKKDGDQATQFQQIVSKFLATHSLRDVSPWLQNCEPQPVSSCVPAVPGCSRPASYTYYAPAPVASSRMLSTYVHMNPDSEGVRKVFGTRIGFFWQTVDDHREIHDDDWWSVDCAQETKDDHRLTQVTMVLIKPLVYRTAEALFAVLARTLQHGLDIAGVRLAVTAQESSTTSDGYCPLGNESDHAKRAATDSSMLPDDVRPVLAIALRGAFARPVWLEELGPADPLLARRTDPNSLTALYGGNDRHTTNLHTPRNEYKVAEELAIYFGGRVPENGVISVGTDTKAVQPCSADEDDLILTDEPSSIAHLLTATVASDVLLFVSPLLPVRCYGIVISVCQRRGYAVLGFRRKRLTTKQAAGMGVAGEMAGYFASLSLASDEAGMQTHASSSAATEYEHHGDKTDVGVASWYTRPAAILHLRKENAGHHAVSLIECFMVQLTLQGLLDGVCQAIKDGKLRSSHLFHVIPYTKHALQAYAGGEFTKVPDLDSPAAPGYIAPRLHNNPELEQVVILALLGHKQATTFGLLLADILGIPPHQKSLPKGLQSATELSPGSSRHRSRPAGLELLGMKWLPKLTVGQAKELTPCEPGDREWKSSLQKLTAGPAIILCLRGVRPHDFLRRLLTEPNAEFLPFKKEEKYEKILSPTLEMAYRLASMFFFDSELFPDDESRPSQIYLPPYRSRERVPHDGHQGGRLLANCGSAQKQARPHAAHTCSQESILKGMLLGPRPLATLLVVKPTVVRRSNLARLFRTLSHEGFRLAGLSLRACTEAEALQILPACLQPTDSAACSQQAVDAKLRAEHMQLMTSDESLIVCLLRENGVRRLLDILGPEDPAEAKKLDSFLWRGCYGSTLVNNGFYGSTSYASSVNDIKRFFPDGLCCLPTLDLEYEEIPTACLDSRVIANKRTILVGTAITSVTGHHERPAADLLLEVNCLLLMPTMLVADSKQRSSGRAQPSLVDVLECLQAMSFTIVGSKLLLLSEEQARCYLHLVSAGSFQLVPELTSAPCLVVAVQRDNAVTTFPYLLQSGFAKANIEPSNYENQIIYPKDIETAKKLIGFFFDSLSTASRWKICEDT